MTTARASDSTSKKPLISLIRHAETVANVAHLLQGSTDSPLSVHGQNQVNALVKAIQRGRVDSNDRTNGSCPLLKGVAPTEIWSSPLGRTWKLANAICDALEASSDKDATQDEHSRRQRRINLVARSGLEEKSFGNRECSRAGKHVSDFPVGVKPMEDAYNWRARVKEEGKAVLERAVAMTSESGTQRSHLVIVSHGLWISCFFDLFLNSSMRPPFADNTGLFTVAIEEGSNDKLTVICANDTSHLTGLKRQRGGIGSSASDKRQKTLGDMWKKK